MNTGALSIVTLGPECQAPGGKAVVLPGEAALLDDVRARGTGAVSDRFVAGAAEPRIETGGFATRPARLGPPSLPVAPTTMKPAEVAEKTAFVMATVADFVDGLRLGAGEIEGRTRELLARPEASFLLQQTTPDLAAKLCAAADGITGSLAPQTGEGHASGLALSVRTAIVEPVVSYLTNVSAGATITGSAAAGDRVALTHTALLSLEAGVEFVIGKCAELLQGEGSKDIDALGKDLQALMDEKKKILGRINEQFAKINTIHAEMKSRADAMRAKEKEGKGFWGSLGDVLTTIKDAAFATVLIPLMKVMTAVLVISKVAEMVPLVGDKLKDLASWVNTALYTLFMTWGGVLGISDDTLQWITRKQGAVANVVGKDGYDPRAEAKQWFDENLASNDIYRTSVMVGSIAVAVAMTILSFGTAAPALLTTIIRVISVANAIIMLVQGAAKIEASIYMQEIAAIQKECAELRIQLSEVEAEIKAILLKVDRKRSEEEDAKADIEDAQDRQGRISANVAKAAESFTSYLRGQEAYA